MTYLVGTDIGTLGTKTVLVDHDGYVHFAWNSDDSLGGTIGLDRDVLHSRTNFATPGYTAASRWQLYR